MEMGDNFCQKYDKKGRMASVLVEDTDWAFL
jgi:hypothetical protein